MVRASASSDIQHFLESPPGPPHVSKLYVKAPEHWGHIEANQRTEIMWRAHSLIFALLQRTKVHEEVLLRG